MLLPLPPPPLPPPPLPRPHCRHTAIAIAVLPLLFPCCHRCRCSTTLLPAAAVLQPPPPRPPPPCRRQPSAADAATNLALPMPPPSCPPLPHRCCGRRIAIALSSRCPLLLLSCCHHDVHHHHCWLIVVFYPSTRCSCRVRRIQKLSNSLVVTRWPPWMPVNSTHMIGGTRRVGWVLGEGGVGMGFLGLPCSSHVLPGS